MGHADFLIASIRGCTRQCGYALPGLFSTQLNDSQAPKAEVTASWKQPFAAQKCEVSDEEPVIIFLLGKLPTQPPRLCKIQFDANWMAYSLNCSNKSTRLKVPTVSGAIQANFVGTCQ